MAAVGCALSIATEEGIGRAAGIDTPPQPFNVRAQVYTACTFTTQDLFFNNYAIGQLGPSFSSTNWTVTCPGAGTGAPPRTQPVRFTMHTVSGTFSMRAGGFGLDYLLCNDPACTQAYAQNVAGPPVSVNALPFTYRLYGEILGGQAARRGAYNQQVRVIMTY